MLRDPSGSDDARPRGRRSRPLSVGLVAALAVLASLTGLALWFHLLAGPVRLGTGLLDASRHLDKAGTRLSKGATGGAEFEALAGSAGAHRARSALEAGAPLLDVLEAAPVVGPALDEVDHLVAAAEHSATAARGSVSIAANALEGPDSIIERGGKGRGGSKVKLDRIVEIGEEIVGLRAEVVAAQEELRAIDLDNLPRRARSSIDKALRKAGDAEDTLIDADAAFKILPGILGADGPRTYLIGFQNSAEARGTGGAILQFAVMNIDEGDFKLDDNAGSIYAVDENRQQLDIPLPEDAWYQLNIPDSRRFGNANWSPDFPLSTDLLLDYAYASSVEFPQIDGVIAVDPKVIEELVPAVGPIPIGEGEKLAKNEVVNYILNGQYGRFPHPAERRRHLQQLVDRFYEDIFDPKSPTKLLEGLSSSLSAKRMQIWMNKPEEQDFIKLMNWDGALEKKKGNDYLLAVEQNVGGNKLDFFDSHENRVSIELDGEDARTSAAFSVSNGALLPQPRWVMGDSGGADADPLHRPMMVLYTRPDSELISASVDGTRVDTPPPAAWPAGTPPAYFERGRKAWPVTMEASPGETVTAHFDYSIPGIVRLEGGRKVYRLTVQHQPKVHPEWLSIDLSLPGDARDIRVEGWKRAGADGLLWEGQLKKDMTLEVSWRD